MTNSVESWFGLHDPGSGWLLKAIYTAVKLHGADVDRPFMLKARLGADFTCDQVNRAIEHSPVYVGMPADRIAVIAGRIIRGNALRQAASILLCGVPRGPLFSPKTYGSAMLALWHAIVLSQELAYLYSWPDLHAKGMSDDDIAFQILLLIGVMLGFDEARRLLSMCAPLPAGARPRLRRVTLSEVKRSALCARLIRSMEESISGEPSRFKTIGKVPVAGRLAAAISSALTLYRMGRRLKKHLSGTGDWRCSCSLHQAN